MSSPDLAARDGGGESVMRNTDFLRLWFSNAVTNFGAQITMLALPITAAVLLHATPTQMGMLAALETLPFMLFGLPAGVLLDRKRRLPIMLCSDFVVMLALASVPLAWWLHLLDIYWLYVVGFIIGSGYVFGGSAEQVFLTFIVGRDRLVDAQARFASTESAARLLGPGIAGVLAQALGAPLAVLCNAAGFALSLLNLRMIRTREPEPQPKDTHPVREMIDGLAFVWHHKLLRQLAWLSGLWHLLFFGFMALHVLFATRVLGMSAGVMGMAQMMGGVGILVGSVMIKRLTVRFGTGRAMAIGLFGSAVGFVLLPLLQPGLFGSEAATAAGYAVAMFWIDCGSTVFFIPYAALRQKVTPDELLGRMISTMRFLTVAMAPAGAMLAGLLAEQLSVRSGLVCVAAGGVLLTLATIFNAGLARIKD